MPQFWKQFFEASANVSLSGYEEPPADDEVTTTERDDPTATTPSASSYNSPEPNTRSNQPYHEGDTLSPSPIHSTPRPQRLKQPMATAPYSSPYETLKRETLGSSPSESTLPSTPRAAASPVPQSSPFAPPSTSHHAARRTPANDVLHRILDKNWRIQATPHTTTRLPQRSKYFTDATPKPSTAKKGRHRAREDYDLDSSPAVPAPQLHSDIFDTPARKNRVPGVSVITPARGRKTTATESGKKGKQQQIWDSDSDDDEGGMGAGMSPPKTMQFHVPQPRLLKTPAREASKRIVEDLLLTAGGNVTDDLEEDDSPNVVQRARLGDEDTF